MKILHDPDGWVKNLCAAVVITAVEDYGNSLLGRKANGDHRHSRAVQSECEWFFKSQWFVQICDISGEAVIEKVHKQIKNWPKKKKYKLDIYEE